MALRLLASSSPAISQPSILCWLRPMLPPPSPSLQSLPWRQSKGFSRQSRRTIPELLSNPLNPNHTCRAAAAASTAGEGEYVFPDPIPDFADAETEKFRRHLHKKLMKKDIFGDSLDDVLLICTQIMSTFLHSEYGGPGTLLVIPFIDMADSINERGLPGGPQAARAAVVWAQKHVDNDWKMWKESQMSSADE